MYVHSVMLFTSDHFTSTGAIYGLISLEKDELPMQH